jgi:HlyD family type I secretion membrane fusion protein
VQHFEGGIVRAILVKEGDRIAEGQVLLQLEDTRARAQQQLLDKQYRSAQALAARLAAERDGVEAIAFPADLLAAATADAEVAAMVATQEQAFAARRQALEGQLDILKSQIEQQNEEIEGLDAQRRAAAQQLALIQEEVLSAEELFAKGLERKSRLLALKRSAADLEGTRAAHAARIASIRQAIGEAELKMIDLRNVRASEVLKELRETQGQLSDITERLGASSDVLTRTEVRAPQEGIVVGLRVHTVGGVVEPAGVLMEIVPQEEALIVEARVRPEDIDTVRQGQKAEVRLTGISQRNVPPLDGTLTYVSADRLVEQQTGLAYYKANVEVDPQSVHLAGDIEMVPGMPAEVIIVTGASTPLEYFLQPITIGLDRALRED